MARGRPSKADEWLTKDNLILVEGWAREGLSDEQIAHNIGIVTSTLYVWKTKYKDFSEAIKKGKAPVDYEVENAMLKSALGYYVTVKKPIKVKTERQKVGEGRIVEEHIEYANEQVYIKPDTTAQIFWLKNRRSDRWRDKQEQIITTVEDLTPLAEMLNAEDEDDSVEEAVTEA